MTATIGKLYAQHPNEVARKKLLSVVVPAFNEGEVLCAFHERLSGTLATLALDAEIVYVNDGSNDETLQIIECIRRDDPRVALVDLSRNFGKEIALSAGLDHAQGDAVVAIDADLQDPPELIPELVRKWLDGYDNVYAKRSARDGETLLKKATAKLFYRVIQRVSKVRIPEDTGDFRLLSRRAVDSLKKMREQHRFMKGLFAWIGYAAVAVPYRRNPRFAGHTKWNYSKLLTLALEGITSFTIAPLKVSTYIGLMTAVAAGLFGVFIVYRTIIYGDPVRGYPSLMVVVLFLGAVQLVGIGIIGEYLGRMFDETKRRPLYFLNTYSAAVAYERVDGGEQAGGAKIEESDTNDWAQLG